MRDLVPADLPAKKILIDDFLIIPQPFVVVALLEDYETHSTYRFARNG